MINTKVVRKEKKYKLNGIIQDMPHLRNRLKKYDEERKSRIQEAKDNRSIRKVVKMWAEDKLRPKVLTQQQLHAIFLLTDLVNNFPRKYVAMKVGVNSQTLSKWLNDPMFIRGIDKAVTERLNMMRLPALRNVFRSISRGNIKDSWKYLEMTGDYKKRIQVDETDDVEKGLSDEELESQLSQYKSLLEDAHVPSDN